MRISRGLSWLGLSNRRTRLLQRIFPGSNFILLHYSYFICTILICALIVWGSSIPPRSVSFTDALFLAGSAMTEAGLNTINLSTLNSFQQSILFVLIMIGSAIFVSAFIVYIRLKAFEKEFNTHVESRMRNTSLFKNELPHIQRESQAASDIELFSQNRRSGPDAAGNVSSGAQHETERSFHSERHDDHFKRPDLFNDDEVAESGEWHTAEQLERGRPASEAYTLGPPLSPPSSPRRHHRASNETSNHATTRRPLFSFAGVGADANSTLHKRSISGQHPAILWEADTAKAGKQDNIYRLASGTISRNSQFHGLTAAERRHLGGLEYRAVLFLSFLVPIYFVTWQLLGAISLGAWVQMHRANTTRENGLNPFWVGAFNAISAFNNSGMSLLDANMIAFQDSAFMLVSMGLFILAGNTAYPIYLRLIVWIMWKVLPSGDTWKDARETLRFLLDHPRRCYTNMFPARHTWWLSLAVLTLNGIDWAAFEILNIGNRKITVLDPNIEVIDGLFQAIAVRSGGFYVVAIPSIRISLQVLYVIMMYISVYPVVISMRNSNVYEERSLGIFAGESRIENDYSRRSLKGTNKFLNIFLRARGLATAPQQEDRTYFVKQQLRAQLAHDVWWIALAVFVIMIIEGAQFEADPAVFSVFNVIFEVVSAYGTVGISIGVPDAAYSFCGSWHASSKMVLVAVMIRGRHRGLPVAIDHAVQLPGVLLDEAEEEDGRARNEGVERLDWSQAVV